MHERVLIRVMDTPINSMTHPSSFASSGAFHLWSLGELVLFHYTFTLWLTGAHSWKYWPLSLKRKRNFKTKMTGWCREREWERSPHMMFYSVKYLKWITTCQTQLWLLGELQSCLFSKKSSKLHFYLQKYSKELLIHLYIEIPPRMVV